MPHAGRVHRAAGPFAPRHAGSAAGLFAADRDAAQRNGLGRASRSGSQTLWRRLKVLAKKAGEIEAVLRSMPGAADVNTEQITGQPMLEIKIDQDQVARYGVSAKTVLDFVESIGSKPLGEVVEGQLAFSAGRPAGGGLAAKCRDDRLTPGADRLRRADPLSRLAKVAVIEGPSTITREWGQRRLTVTANVRGRDLGSFVAEARKQIAEKVSLPSGRYRIEYGGQFENLERAERGC